MSRQKINLRVSEINNGQWGEGFPQEVAQIIARNVGALAVAYAEREWRGCEITLEFTRDYTKDRVAGSPAGKVRAISNYLDFHWFRKHLRVEDFDASGYVFYYPRAKDYDAPSDETDFPFRGNECEEMTREELQELVGLWDDPDLRSSCGHDWAMWHIAFGIQWHCHLLRVTEPEWLPGLLNSAPDEHQFPEAQPVPVWGFPSFGDKTQEETELDLAFWMELGDRFPLKATYAFSPYFWEALRHLKRNCHLNTIPIPEWLEDLLEDDPEAKRPVIHLKVSKFPGCWWGPDAGAPLQQIVIPTLAKNLLALAIAVGRREFPHTRIEGVVTEDEADGGLSGTPPELVVRIKCVLPETDSTFYRIDFDPERYLSQCKCS